MNLELGTGLVAEIDERERAMLNLAFTYSVVLGRTVSALKPFSLNDQHYNIMKILVNRYPDPVSVGEIHNLLLDKRGDLTRLIDKLVNLKLVTREVNPLNRRSVNVAVSSYGLERLQLMDERLAAERNALSGLSEDEARALNALLDKLRATVTATEISNPTESEQL